MGPVGPASFATAPVKHGWYPSAHSADCLALYENGEHTGCWYPDETTYRRRTANGEWGPRIPITSDMQTARVNWGFARVIGDTKTTAPTAEQTKPAPPKPELDFPTGVISSELGKHGQRYLINGEPVTRQDVVKKLTPKTYEGGELKDDSTKLRLTLIGQKPDRDRVLAELPTDLKDRYLVQAYDPDNWAVKNYGFVTTGKPTIYLQQPDGKVLCRTDAYEGQKTWTAVRKADPTYDPNKDPNGSKPLIPGGDIVKQITDFVMENWLLLLGIFLAYRMGWIDRLLAALQPPQNPKPPTPAAA